MKRNHTEAFSLLEVILAMVLGLGLLLLVKDSLLSTLRLQSFTKDRNVWQMLEDDLRRSFHDSAAFSIAKTQNPLLLNCLTEDGANCPAGPKPIELFLSKDLPTTGGFSAFRSPCKEKSCPVRIEAVFTGLCRQAAPCDMAGAISVDYRILINDALYRQGSMQRNNLAREAGDESYSCEADAAGEVGFATRISATAVDCINAPA
ncbi:MAG: hypothetical protein M3Q07_06535, partial [Pseudobdellovibrionaceae bacterium]|nr:hypothetical protein [Pseudobdellovibrionaceae bacterium]